MAAKAQSTYAAPQTYVPSGNYPITGGRFPFVPRVSAGTDAISGSQYPYVGGPGAVTAPNGNLGYASGQNPSSQAATVPGAYPFVPGQVQAPPSQVSQASPYSNAYQPAPPPMAGGAAGSLGEGSMAGAGAGAAPGAPGSMTSPTGDEFGGAVPSDIASALDAAAPSLGQGTGAAIAATSAAPFGFMGDLNAVQPRMVYASALGGNGLQPLPGSVGGTQPLPRPIRNPGSPLTPGALGPQVFVASVRALKVTENMSPMPQDRFFVNFNFYDNLAASLNRQLHNDITHLRVYQELFGYEKTFANGQGSVGIRLPLNSLVTDSKTPGIGGTSTALGDLSAFFKYIWLNRTFDNGSKFVSTFGALVTPPTGPRAFASAPGFTGFRSTYIQPFVGYVYSQRRFYFQGFTSFEVPVGTGTRDVTSYFQDLGLGYFLLQDRSPGRLITAIAPTWETHLNIPLNHVGYNPRDAAGTPNIVNMTFGVNFELMGNGVLALGYATPVTAPHPFDYEFLVQFNYFFGRSRRSMTPAGTIYPLLGG
ncbi:MAG TPA: hypothetical protein VFT74_20630 [Isosphaeraceae bacterium]|nr:hypothetical protein [Isosphaeraceae bacterium]